MDLASQIHAHNLSFHTLTSLRTLQQSQWDQLNQQNQVTEQHQLIRTSTSGQLLSRWQMLKVLILSFIFDQGRTDMMQMRIHLPR